MVNERRRNRRSQVLATIVLDPGTSSATYYVVRNLSAGGALVTGEPVPPLGAQLRLVLNLRTGRAVNLAAKVIRREPHRDVLPTFAIEFHQVSADAEDLIQDAVLAELELSGSDNEPGAKRGQDR